MASEVTVPLQSPSPSASGRTRVRAKYLLFGFIGLMFGYVLVNNESFLIIPNHPFWQHIDPYKWVLLLHGVPAATALLLGPLQFSERLRRRYTKLHRVAGRVYVAAVLIGAPLGAYVQWRTQQLGYFAPSFTIETILQASLWILTTLIALVFIRQGKVQQHRVWMTRSFGTGPLIFLEVRVILGLTGFEQKYGPGAIETVVWFCTASSIFVADCVLQVQELLQNRAASRARAARVAATAGAD